MNLRSVYTLRKVIFLKLFFIKDIFKDLILPVLFTRDTHFSGTYINLNNLLLFLLFADDIDVLKLEMLELGFGSFLVTTFHLRLDL